MKKYIKERFRILFRAIYVLYHKPMRMYRSIARVKGAGYILWHGKHIVFHVLLGLMWAWMLRELWNVFNSIWILTAVIGSLLPDVDHFLYFFTYGKRDPYTRTVVTFFKNRQWRVLTTFIARNHKRNTSLTFHNYYAVLFCIIGTLFALYTGWRAGVMLFGAMTGHFLFDIFEDIILLGHLNANWSRWGSGRRRA